VSVPLTPSVPRLEAMLRAVAPVKGTDRRAFGLLLERVNVNPDEETGTLRLTCYLESTGQEGVSRCEAEDAVINIYVTQDEVYDRLFRRLFAGVLHELEDAISVQVEALNFARR